MNSEKFKSGTRQNTLNLVLIAMLAVVIAVCSWVTVPMTVPFTLQTFGVFCAVGLLGGKRGTLSVLVYILLGAVGLPVFSGFKGGIGTLLGTTGGYIVGFIFTALIYWLVTKIFGTKTASMIMGMILGLAACYAFGTAWFILVYIRNTGAMSVATALGYCVTPFIIPDLIKLALAVVISKTVPKYIKMPL